MLVKAGDSASDAIGKIGKDFDLTRLPGIRDAAGVLDKLKEDGKLTAAEFQAAWAKALDGKDLAVFETTARAAFIGTKREAALLAELLDAGLRESVKRAGLDFENLRGGISKTAQSAVNDTQTIIDGLGRLSAQGVDTGRALAASIGKGIDTADTQKALDLVKQQIESVRAKLGETVANGLLDQAKQKSMDLKEALEKALPGIQSVSEAMGRLGLQSTESLQLAAKTATEAFAVIKAKGQEEGESYVAWQARKQEAGRVMIDRAIAANRGMADSTIASRAAMEGLEVQTDSTGRAIVSAMGSGSRAMSDLGGYTRQTTQDLKAQAAALDAINDRYSRPGAGASPHGGGGNSPKLGGDKNNYDPGYGSPYSRPGEGPVNGNGQTKDEYDRGQRLSGQSAQDLTLQFSLLEKIQKKTLTAADLVDAKAVVASLKVNNQTNQDLDKFGGAFSAAGALDRSKWETVQAQLQNFINAQESAARAGMQVVSPSDSKSTDSASAISSATITDYEQQLRDATARGDANDVRELKYEIERLKAGQGVSQPVSASTTVNINLNGNTQSINTDAAGAATLQAILRQLGGAQSTSSIR